MDAYYDGTVLSAEDPIWIDNVWLDTVVVVGLTCFILCLMGLSKVRRLRFIYLCDGISPCYKSLNLLRHAIIRFPPPKWE